MDRNEYLQWLDYHGAADPNWRANMRAMPNAKDVSDQLQKRLQTASLEGAKRATDQMVEDPSLKPFRAFAIGYIELFRGLPALITLLFVGFGLPIAFSGFRIPGGVLGRGSVGLALVAGAYMAETIRAGIEAVPKGQMAVGLEDRAGSGRRSGTRCLTRSCQSSTAAPAQASTRSSCRTQGSSAARPHSELRLRG